jgi:hypothetical protein
LSVAISSPDEARLRRRAPRSRQRGLDRALAILMLPLGLAACRRQCSELGCFERGVILELAPTIAARGEVALEVGFDGTTHTCDTREPLCKIDDRYPAELTLRFVKNGQVVRKDQRKLTYVESFPNGEQCSGRCAVARLKVD